MNVIVRAKQGQSRLRSLRRGHDPQSASRPRQPSAVHDLAPPKRKRDWRRAGGPAQDRATYNCQCGLVFDAAVSTAVSCPHCGHQQAW